MNKGKQIFRRDARVDHESTVIAAQIRREINVKSTRHPLSENSQVTFSVIR